MTRILRQKIVQIEFSDGIVLKAIQDVLQGLTKNLKELLLRYCTGSEQVAARFNTVFSEQYKARIKSMVGEEQGKVMEHLIAQ